MRWFDPQRLHNSVTVLVISGHTAYQPLLWLQDQFVLDGFINFTCAWHHKQPVSPLPQNVIYWLTNIQSTRVTAALPRHCVAEHIIWEAICEYLWIAFMSTIETHIWVPLRRIYEYYWEAYMSTIETHIWLPLGRIWTTQNTLDSRVPHSARTQLILCLQCFNYLKMDLMWFVWFISLVLACYSSIIDGIIVLSRIMDSSIECAISCVLTHWGLN